MCEPLKHRHPGTPVRQRVGASVLLACWLLTFIRPAVAADDTYPTTVTTVEQMQLAKPISISFPATTTVKTRQLRTVVIASHVGLDGRVVKSRIEKASGANHVDEAVLLAMKNVRFVPYAPQGEPLEVTVVVPMHVARDDVMQDRRLGTRPENAPVSDDK